MNKGEPRMNMKLEVVSKNGVLKLSEIEPYVSGRYITAFDAAWRLFGFKIFNK